jgi:hypothetical protein
VKTTLDGVDQRDYLEGKSGSARDTFFYYADATPSAVRYKNWKMYFSMVPTNNPLASFYGPQTYHWTLIDNIKRDPFETAVGETEKTGQGMGGALGGPLTATTGTCCPSVNSCGCKNSKRTNSSRRYRTPNLTICLRLSNSSNRAVIRVTTSRVRQLAYSSGRPHRRDARK